MDSELDQVGAIRDTFQSQLGVVDVVESDHDLFASTLCLAE